MKSILIGAAVSLLIGSAGIVGTLRWADARCGAKAARAEAEVATARAELAELRADALELAVTALSGDIMKQKARAVVEDRNIRDRRRADPTCEEAWNAPLHACIGEYIAPDRP